LDDTLFVGNDSGNLYAIDTSTRTEEWTYETDAIIDSSPTVADRTVFVGNDDGAIFALDVDSGVYKWGYKTGDEIRSSPTVVAGTLYIGSDDGNVYALDAPVSGSSEGSRIRLETIGHHNVPIGDDGEEEDSRPDDGKEDTEPDDGEEDSGGEDGSGDSGDLSRYTDSDGYVDTEGLLDAGDDYRNGEIGEDRLSEVASAFRSGEPLS
jgi:hypothetical protein